MAQDSEVLVSCEASAECVLGATGLAYLSHADPLRVRLCRRDRCQPRLGEQVVELEGSDSLTLLARRVFLGLERTVARGCGRSRRGTCSGCEGACASRVLYACASDDTDMPQAVHNYVRLCFSEGPRVAQMIAHPVVARLDGMARRVIGECEHTRQFVRFSQAPDGSFFASFSPNADTVPLVAGHFAARMGGERFCLLDPVHRVACLHEPGSSCRIVRLDGQLAESLASIGTASEEELAIRELWRTFYRGITLPGRSPEERGYDLRASWVPKRFWPGLTELG